MRRLCSVAAAVALSLAGLAAMAAPASAGAPYYRTTIGSWVVQADMKPIAGTDANNTGLARPGDILDIYCQLSDNHNVRWDLALNHSGRAGQQFAETIGFVPYSTTAGVYQVPSCNDRFFPIFAFFGKALKSPYVQADMKPIPGTDANNTGLFRAGDSVDGFCSLSDNHNMVWVLVINRNGHAGQQFANTVGFVPYDVIDGIGITVECPLPGVPIGG